jgi:hypothetical protein
MKVLTGFVEKAGKNHGKIEWRNIGRNVFLRGRTSSH